MTEDRPSTSEMREREAIIHNYIAGYNNFDIELMIANMDENIRFENVANGETNIQLKGLSAFKDQAIAAKEIFSSRKQTIKSFKHQGNETEAEINYCAVVAIDLPNGLSKGMELMLNGKSVFTFSGNMIVELTDIS